jgi:prolyl-tRNA synthetase
VVRSYRQLPSASTNFQIKSATSRARAPACCARASFIRKDAYTFDRDRRGLGTAHYDRYREAYTRVMERCGLEWYRVESDVGMMGGFGAHEYMAPCARGRERRSPWPAGLRGPTSGSRARPAPVELPAGSTRRVGETPG